MSVLHSQALTKRPAYVAPGYTVVGICVVSKNDKPADEQPAPMWWAVGVFFAEKVPSGFTVWRLQSVLRPHVGECAFENAEQEALSFAEEAHLPYCPMARHGMPAKVML